MVSRSMASAEAVVEGVRALVSIHDVMPDTLRETARILDLLERADVAPVTLLVVPGTGWKAPGLKQLRAFQDAGHVLAGHGWLHHVERFVSLRHRLHGRLISRQVAEHLALDAGGIAALIERCHRWFGEAGLAPPRLYVPPAWAMGAIPRNALAALPFDQYELFSGVLSARTGQLRRIALTGYEADTPLRAPLIRAWNRYNRRRARALGWLRIGIHPHDLDLRLAEDLRADLRRFPTNAGYDAVPDSVTSQK